MHSRFLILSFVPALTLLNGCSDKAASLPEQVQFAATSVTAPEPSQSAPAPGASVESFWAAQKLIRSAEMQMEVKDVDKAVRAVDSVVKQRGALLADTRLSRDDEDRRQAELIIRVPSDRFVETLAALRRIGDVKGERVNTQDVTKEYADLETRLVVKDQTVARLRSLLENRTAKLSDVLEVERELARAVTELEQMKGERRYYDQRIAVSTITLGLFDHAIPRAMQLTGPIGEALRSSLGVLGRSFSGLIYAIAFLLPWAVLVALLWWPITRLRRLLRGTPR